MMKAPGVSRDAEAGFLRAMDVSCYRCGDQQRAQRPVVHQRLGGDDLDFHHADAAENYGYMAPVKAALDSSLVFLAKSFSRFSQVRFQRVARGC